MQIQKTNKKSKEIKEIFLLNYQTNTVTFNKFTNKFKHIFHVFFVTNNLFVIYNRKSI